MTHLAKIIELAAKSLMVHKFRSFLSALGIIFGVMAVVAMLAVGGGAKRESLRQIELLGTNNLIVRALALTDAEKLRAEEKLSPGLTLADADALSSLPGVVRAAALRSLLVESIQGPSRGKPSVVGVTETWAEITNLRLAEGSFISERHVLGQSRVCVLGAEAASKLRPGGALGESVPLGNEWFTVVGVLEAKDYSGGGQVAITPRNSNNDIYIPVSVTPEGVARDAASADELWVQAADTSVVAALSRVVRDTLTRAHFGVTDFEVLVPHELLRQKQQTVRVFNTVLGCIAGISLLVGGIGIMNIMLATVSERTREIGICRALGACRSDIVIQFLAESVVLTLLGGVLGIAFGWAAAGVIAAWAGWATVLSWQSVVAAALISALVGIFFGLYPARKAAAMDPIAALRFE